MVNQPNAPISQNKRINHLDILRGFALLGILIMNIQSFSMPGAAYLNPTAWGNLEGINLIVWSLSNIFADSKFMGIFSILFGAGICLFAERALKKGGKSTALHYKRNFLLLIFGLIHAHFIWYGDVLVIYALCSFWVYWFRNRTPRFLTITAVLVISVASLYSLFVHYAIVYNKIPEQGVIEILSFWKPSAAQLNAQISAYTGNLIEQFHQRTQEAFVLETQVFLTTFMWRAGGMMLLGMALYQSGVLSGKKSLSYYWIMSVVGIVIGLSISSYGLLRNFAEGFNLEYSMFLGSQFNYWGSVLTALGYIGLINLIINKGLLKSLQDRLAAVGQMAFTNYIMQSLICTFIFYGHGLGLFAQVERWQQIIMVLFVWIFQLWYSPVWLSKYRFGPLEWAWRSLTYWQAQPLKKVS